MQNGTVRWTRINILHNKKLNGKLTDVPSTKRYLTLCAMNRDQLHVGFHQRLAHMPRLYNVMHAHVSFCIMCVLLQFNNTRNIVVFSLSNKLTALLLTILTILIIYYCLLYINSRQLLQLQGISRQICTLSGLFSFNTFPILHQYYSCHHHKYEQTSSNTSQYCTNYGGI